MKEDFGRSPYEEIINHPHFVSGRYPPMPMEKRAAQFSPFKAMVGYEDEVEEEARFTDSEIYLDENRMDELDERLREIMEAVQNGERPAVEIKYFVPDERKEGGAYSVCRGKIRRVDTQGGRVIMEGGQKILLSKIVEIQY